MTDKITSIISHLQSGGLVIVIDDDDREAEGDLVGIASLATPETVNFMIQQAGGLICVPMAPKIAEKLNLPAMTAENTDHYQTAFTVSVDHESTSTGISAADRAATIKALANPLSSATEFRKPGHIFPLVGVEGGVVKRRGHTEAAIDLASLAGQFEVAYICEILNSDGTMARKNKLIERAQEWHLPVITVQELVNYREKQVHKEVTVKLPTAYGEFDLTMYTATGGLEHLLLSMGEPTKEPVLVRIHSECLTGDVFSSHRCDCGEQLQAAMKRIAEEGSGHILYLRQEGRGIGLLNKMKAYKLQESGWDTYEANQQLGFSPDERDYRAAVGILNQLELTQIKLLTNNPDKIQALTDEGLTIVERIPLETTVYQENKDYLTTKKTKSHHLFSL